jgi:hypothetical protein
LLGKTPRGFYPAMICRGPTQTDLRGHVDGLSRCDKLSQRRVTKQRWQRFYVPERSCAGSSKYENLDLHYKNIGAAFSAFHGSTIKFQSCKHLPHAESTE